MLNQKFNLSIKQDSLIFDSIKLVSQKPDMEQIYASCVKNVQSRKVNSISLF